jgi:hypothetical protein
MVRTVLSFRSIALAGERVANKHAEVLTPEERKQIMGNRGDVYERHYMPAFIDRDCQAIYLGTTRRDDLIRAVGRLERHEQAPTALTDVQKFDIQNHPDVVKLVELREKYVRKIKRRGYPTIKAAEGTLWYERHGETQRELNSLKEKLSSELLEKTIDEFHESVHTIEVERQLRGIRLASDVLTPSTIEYELEERAVVARLLFKPTEDLDEDHVYQVRIKLVQSLVQLSKRQETPHSYKAPRTRKSKDAWKNIEPHEQGRPPYENDGNPNISQGEAKGNTQADVDWDTKTLVDDESDVDSIAPVEFEERPIVPVLYCAFCKWGDEEAGPQKRKHIFSRPDSLGRHVRVQHLENRAAGEGFDCPYRGCSAFLGGAEHFLNHTQRQHGLRL